VPLGAWARYEDGEIVMDGFVVTDKLVRGHARGTDSNAVGLQLADRLS
jgi:hypothetical protein